MDTGARKKSSNYQKASNPGKPKGENNINKHEKTG
jgi:hypothetical protein